jgi:PKD repeat protein
MVRLPLRAALRPIFVALLLGGITILGGVAVISAHPATGASQEEASVSTASATIVSDPPSTNFNATVASNVTNGTAPLTVQFDVNVTGGAPPFTYLWQFGDSNNSGYLTASFVTHTYTYPGTFGVEVNVTNATGYTYHLPGPTIDVMSSSPPNPITVRLQASTMGGPVPLNFGATASPSGCTPECNVTMFLSGGSSPGYTPIGTDPGPEVANGQNYTVTASITTSGTWTVTAIAAQPDGLSGYAEWAIDATPVNGPFSVTISAYPAGGPAPLSVALAANTSGGVGLIRADWSFGDGGNGSGALVHHTYLDPGSYDVQLYAWDANGSVANASTQIVVTSGSTGGAGLTATLTASPSAGSAPLTVHLLVAAAGGAPPYALSVCGGAGNCSYTQTGWDGSAENLTAVYATAGNFSATATVTDSGGNQSVASTLVSVVAYQPLKVSANDSVLSGTSPLEVELAAFLHGGAAPFSIQWAFGDGSYGSSYSGAVITHLYATPGRYVPVVTVRDVTGREIVESLAAVVVPGSAPSTPLTAFAQGGSGTAALLLVGALAGAGVAYAIGQAIQRRRLRREGEDLVAALRATDRPPP